MLKVTPPDRDPFVCYARGSICIDHVTIGEYLLWGKHWNRDEDGRQIGYRILPQFQNCGFMTEALKLIIPHVPVEFRRLIIKPWNLASIRVAEKCGFKEYVGLDTRETYWRLP